MLRVLWGSLDCMEVEPCGGNPDLKPPNTTIGKGEEGGGRVLRGKAGIRATLAVWSG